MVDKLQLKNLTEMAKEHTILYVEDEKEVRGRI